MSDLVFCPPNVDCPCYARLVDESKRLREANELMLTDIRRTDVDMLAFKAGIARLEAALDILQAAMTAKKPIPMAFKKAILEARAALEERT